jgi:lysophospholipase L1-like esterase
MAAANIQDVIMLFGDSITQGAWEDGLDGFGQRLSREYARLVVLISANTGIDTYARKLDVVNRGLSGYNTDWAKPVLEQARQHGNIRIEANIIIC